MLGLVRQGKKSLEWKKNGESAGQCQDWDEGSWIKRELREWAENTRTQSFGRSEAPIENEERPKIQVCSPVHVYVRACWVGVLVLCHLAGMSHGHWVSYLHDFKTWCSMFVILWPSCLWLCFSVLMLMRVLLINLSLCRLQVRFSQPRGKRMKCQ